MKGMLTVAKEVKLPPLDQSRATLSCSQELEIPFFFTPSKIASFFHCNSPSLDQIA
jgi:tRNA (guanine26-N2/guanine27-N2)-dimethyltransferase